jgi:hypothetical protein
MPTVTGKITKVVLHADNWNSTDPATFGKGFLEIYMNELPEAPGDTKYRRVAITTDNPVFLGLVHIATSAQRAGAKVEMAYLQSNVARSNSWDFAVLAALNK